MSARDPIGEARTEAWSDLEDQGPLQPQAWRPDGVMCCGHRPGECPDPHRTWWCDTCGHGHCTARPHFQKPDPAARAAAWATPPKEDFT